jgi:hypothetical protein
MLSDKEDDMSSRVAVTNIKISMFKENYPENKLIENDRDRILYKLESGFRGTPKELPHLRFFRLEVDPLMYACTD